MAFRHRLREARLAKNLTQEQLGGLVGLAKSTIAGYEGGNSQPDVAKISQLMTILEIDANFLWQDEVALTNKGSTPTLPAPHEDDLLKNYRILHAESQSMIFKLTESWVAHEQAQYEGDTVVPLFEATPKKVLVELPILGYMAAGVPIEDNAGALDGEFVVVDSRYNADFALITQGDSMEPKIPNGSIVLVRSTPSLADGQIGVFDLDHEYSCKKFVKPNGVVSLESLNPEYPPLSFLGIEEVSIVGQVIGIVEA